MESIQVGTVEQRDEGPILLDEFPNMVSLDVVLQTVSIAVLFVQFVFRRDRLIGCAFFERDNGQMGADDTCPQRSAWMRGQ